MRTLAPEPGLMQIARNALIASKCELQQTP
jgi:hypothetical protein